MKLLLAALAAALAIGLAACGNGDDSTPTVGSASSNGVQKKTGQAHDEAPRKSKKNGGENKPGSGEEGSAGSTSGRGKDIGNFVPKPHEDSGGGSEQLRTKGGDNSVQDFGEEATGSDFEEASTALHNFLDARAVGDWTAACEYLAADFIESLRAFATQTKQPKGMTCGEILGNLTNKAALPLLRKEAEKADVGSLRTEGDRSFIIYRGLEGSVLAMTMTKEGDGWKVASLGGVQLN